MTPLKKLFSFILISAALIFPSFSAADVKISLHNGRTIRADSCKDVGAKLICEKLGGSFEIEKKDVLNLSEPKSAPQYYRSTESPNPETGSPDSGQQAASGQAEQATSKEMKSEETKNRLTLINARKKELLSEREKLELERKQLEQDMKNSPQLLAPSRFDELNRRNLELEEKIRKFNAEVQALDKEEKSITGNKTDSR